MKKDVIIIGAGASGLMCAIEAGKRGRSVLVLDHSEKIGEKIRVSGGGRCNFTNIDIRPDNYISNNPHFCKSALARFTPNDFIAMLERHGIDYYEKEAGQLFCRGSSGEIINMLQEECSRMGVEIRIHCRIEDVKRDDLFTVSTNLGTFETESLVVATGGLSYPKLGATDIGYRIARQFGIKVVAARPALVPFTLTPQDLKIATELSGVSINAVVTCHGRSFRGDILFTHRGLSGPAILQISSYWNPGDVININLLPDTDAYDLFMARRQGRMEMHNLLSEFLPRRFAQKWCELYIQSKPLNQYSDKELKAIAQQIHNWTVKPIGTEGYKTAEVTLGGIDTDELSSKTMEAKKVSGLYFIGEVVDVTGQLGGYNLHWAWASGFAAGQYV
ncbi:MAG: NAD(P)/FAD-dependent oxidoreductase [Deltaproteobacteria bacterium]|nr:NAD(P)/FAD-dependent oxidoreductase [Deltaproteobacteria bacterium]